MKRTFFIITALVLIDFCGFNERLLARGDVKPLQNIQSSLTDHESPGPVDELISLLEKYGKEISESADKDICDSLQNELSNKIDDLAKIYPDFEPCSEELSQIENAFMHYVEITDSSDFFDDDEGYDEESNRESLEQLALIFDNYSDIEDVGQKFLAITEDYTKKFSSTEDLTEIIELTNQYTGLLDNYFDEFEPADSEKAKYEGAIERLASAVNEAMEKATKEME